MRRNMTEEEKQKRIKVREFLKQNPISSPDDLNTFFKDMMKVMIEEFYQGELEEELGYPKIAISWKNNWPRLSMCFATLFSSTVAPLKSTTIFSRYSIF